MSAPCRQYFQIVGQVKNLVQRFQEILTGLLKQCSEQSCFWWCLCCNKWLCWILVVVLAVLFILVTIMFVILSVVVVIICVVLCLLFGIIIRDRDQPFPNCFQYFDDPPAPQ
jgi:hypothetical protein